MSGVGSSRISGVPSRFLSLPVGGGLRAEVGDGGGHDDHVMIGGGRGHRLLHLRGGLDGDEVHPCGTGSDTVDTSVTRAPRLAASAATA